MAIWKEIRKSINSTLGTKGFKPLDKIIRDGYYVYASDDLLKTLYSIDSETPINKISLTDIGTINLSGVVRIQIEAKDGASLDKYNCVYFGKNGTVEPIFFDDSKGGIITLDLEVNKNDFFQFKVEGSTTLNAYVKELKITACGKIGSAPDTGIFIE